MSAWTLLAVFLIAWVALNVLIVLVLYRLGRPMRHDADAGPAPSVPPPGPAPRTNPDTFDREWARMLTEHGIRETTR